MQKAGEYANTRQQAYIIILKIPFKSFFCIGPASVFWNLDMSIPLPCFLCVLNCRS